jgi:hypothetical protein
LPKWCTRAARARTCSGASTRSAGSATRRRWAPAPHGADEVRQRLDPRNYLSPGALWWVFDWQSALKQHNRAAGAERAAAAAGRLDAGKGSVLLIDEIDKAEADLPNGLLETLGNGAFSVPWLDAAVSAPPGMPTPLVVITTNEERELPAAFVRRCLVLNLQLAGNENAFTAR